MLGPFLALASLVFAVVALVPPTPPERDLAGLADDLANTVETQWLDEVKARRLREPRVLPLSWRTTQPPISAADAVVLDPAGTSRLHLDGRLDGRFDEVIRQLADGFGRIPSGRLVILGEPGAGKTVLAVLLTLGLFARRPRGGPGGSGAEQPSPVPVLLAASTWDPVSESMDDWIVRSLALSNYDGRERLPRLLLDRGLLLPILDGLDEIPESARRSAVRGINRAVGAERPVVVTCRSAEYADVITGGVPVLRRTPVVAVCPVSVEDAIAYLDDVDWPDAVRWDTVFARLRADGDPSDHGVGALQAALSTPLMVSIARLVYERCGGRPAELLDEERFDCRHAIEDHLLDRLVDAAYTPAGPRASGRQWDPVRAQRWLTFLAQYLHRYRERDLSWWQLAERLLPRWIGPVVGGGLGLAVMIGTLALGPAIVKVSALLGGHVQSEDVSDAIGGAPVAGAVFVLLAVLVWQAGGGRTPRRLTFAFRGSWARLLHGFGSGAAVIGSVAVPVVIAGTIVVITQWPLSLADWSMFIRFLCLAPAVTAGFGFAFALHSWLNAAPERSLDASPAGFVRHDRRSSLVSAVTTGLIFGLTFTPALIVAWIVGDVAFEMLAGWPESPGNRSALAWGAGLATDWIHPESSRGVGFLLTNFVAPGVFFAILSLLVGAWFRFVIVRAVLAARGVLPWRLLAFLADARAAGLLRQSGSAYQFRHVRLQERLATRRLAADGESAGSHRSRFERSVARVGARRAVLATGGVIALLAALILAKVVPNNSSSVVLHTRAGSTVADLSLAGGTLLVLEDGHVKRGALGAGHEWRVDVDGSFMNENGEEHIAFAADGASLLGFDNGGAVRRWSSSTGRVLTSRPVDRQFVRAISYMAVSGRAEVAAAVTQEGRLHWYDLKSGNWDGTATGLKVGSPTDDHPHLVAVSGDGGTVATSINDSIYVFGTRPRRSILSYPLPGRSVADQMTISDDGQILAMRVESSIMFLNTRSGRLLGEPLSIKDVSAFKFTPDGSELIVSQDDDTIRRWGVLTRRQIGAPFRGHLGSIRALAVGADGRRLVSAGDDGLVRLWSLSSGGVN